MDDKHADLLNLKHVIFQLANRSIRKVYIVLMPAKCFFTVHITFPLSTRKNGFTTISSLCQCDSISTIGEHGDPDSIPTCIHQIPTSWCPPVLNGWQNPMN
jgi:hypothetical protein